MPKKSELSKDVKDCIISKYIAKMSYRKISKDLHVPVSTVGYIIKKSKERGTAENTPRTGAPRKFSIRSSRMISRRIKKKILLKLEGTFKKS